MEIVDGRRHTQGSLEEWAAGPLRRLAIRVGRSVPTIAEVSGAAPILAMVDFNRWLAKCPDCIVGVEYVWLEQPLFMCANCWNHGVGYKWRKVKFPSQRKEIEGILKERPSAQNRAWLPHETVEDLRAENKKQGIKGGAPHGVDESESGGNR